MNASSRGGAPAYRLEKQAVGPDHLESIERSLEGSDYVGASPLGAEFVLTQGFSLVFTRDHLDLVTETFPFLRHFLDTVAFATSNAFFVNPLMMRSGSQVRPHIDCRLLDEQNLRIIPNLVSILYVRVPAEMKGGDIVLGSNRPDAVTMKPQSGDVLHFPGDIVHHVTPILSDDTRLCVVCEQYRLTDEVLDGFPAFDVITDADRYARQSDTIAAA
ncbi:2OG-Fe(II) oxygenase family protein [Sphingomonas endolithica]|uniref:2OG-Fe(II) oxygenase family protein n=1 Tax=Sphingomonas endolithica TaxID=2972485 RepID=UPI0021B05497|nr:2OG-Fe(II) oxygenase family protein [Sphingomonas sp. ZFBP2030]